MIVGNVARRAAVALALLGSVAAIVPATTGTAQAASEISVVVNGVPITSYQIRQRAAFLNLRRVGGNTTQKATDELIDEALKKQEIRRRGISISDDAVNEAFGRFAAENKLTETQLGEVLSRAGFSSDGFKDYIRVQMGWGQAVQANMRSSEKLSEQDVVQRMLAQGGEKPSTTEYTLQQVIFVIPEGQQSALLATRKREAESMRSRFQSCDSTFEFAKGLRDVTVRDLGRVAQPELPPRWKKDIQATSVGRTTPAQQTERGVEFIAVCNTRSISDDKAAAMVFQAREMEKLGEQSEPDADYLKTLRERAQIVRR
ncbi:SurA N-terminal domain-containing protein [Aurantimonas sp. A2-1-M11]|uniref:SurA N-terminal domain-containing protein n=1 Tax=Aurantimonas sp. A2-1-M11 TaxID=3113712 RepID=UPI002F942DC5